jgi:hypothetical protein
MMKPEKQPPGYLRKSLVWDESYKVFEDLIGFLVLKNWNKRAPKHSYNHTKQWKI